jgi:hypothetical protein
MSGERTDTHERHRFREREAFANPNEQLNQVQLIEQVVLKPQDQLVVRVVLFDRVSPLPEVVGGIQGRIGSRPCSRGQTALAGEELDADADQFSIAQLCGNGPFVQRVGPDRTSTWNTGGFNRSGCGGAVRHVKEASHVS